MSEPKRTTVELFDEYCAARVAKIMGEHSAHAGALVELQRRRDKGEVVSLVRDRQTLLVVPTELLETA